MTGEFLVPHFTVRWHGCYDFKKAFLSKPHFKKLSSRLLNVFCGGFIFLKPDVKNKFRRAGGTNVIHLETMNCRSIKLFLHTSMMLPKNLKHFLTLKIVLVKSCLARKFTTYGLYQYISMKFQMAPHEKNFLLKILS